MSLQTSSPTALPPRAVKPLNYRWLIVLIGLGIVVSILLVYAENRVYEPATPFLGGTGDHVHAIALDPQQGAHMYLGTHYGFFRTTDGGAHWARLNGVGGIPGTFVATSISISALDAGTIYATGYTLGSGNAAEFEQVLSGPGYAGGFDDGEELHRSPLSIAGGPSGTLAGHPGCLTLSVLPNRARRKRHRTLRNTQGTFIPQNS